MPIIRENNDINITVAEKKETVANVNGCTLSEKVKIDLFYNLLFEPLKIDIFILCYDIINLNDFIFI